MDTPRPSPRTNRTRRVPQAERESEVPHASGANASAAPAFNATGLRAETNYSVTVTPRSANALGYAGVPAAAVQGVTVHPPGAAVSNLRLIRITPTSVFLAWTPVAPPVTTYLVEGFGAPGGAEPPHEVPQPAAPGDAEFEFTGLDTAREYSFRVTARNLHVAGYSAAPFAEVAGVRLIGLPAPVINLRVASITDTSVSIQWDLAPSHPPASVFQVYYREGSLPFATHGLPETALTHENITGLRRGTMIDLKVFAGTLAGYELEGSVVVSAAPVSRPPPPPSRTKWTRRVPQPVLIGHAASLSQVPMAQTTAAWGCCAGAGPGSRARSRRWRAGARPTRRGPCGPGTRSWPSTGSRCAAALRNPMPRTGARTVGGLSGGGGRVSQRAAADATARGRGGW